MRRKLSQDILNIKMKGFLDLNDILKKYPIKNEKWNFNDDGYFYIFDTKEKNDPWNRTINFNVFSSIEHNKKSYGIHGFTVLNGIKIPLVLLSSKCLMATTNIQLPEVRQVYNFDCGASSVQSVMAYYGFDIREEKIICALGTDSTNGTKVENIITYFKQNGLKVIAKSMDIQELKSYLDKKYPVIMVLQAWRDDENVGYSGDWNDGHYCFLPDTMILTKNGYKPIIEIKEGEEVLTHTGNFKKVINVMKREYSGTICRLKANGMVQSVCSTPEHPFWTKQYKSKKAQLLRQNGVLDNINFEPVSKLNRDFLLFGKQFPIVDNEYINNNKANLLGLYLGDGNLIRCNTTLNGYKGVRFIIGIKEVHLIEKIIHLMKLEFNVDVHYYYPKNNKCVQLIFYGTKIIDFFLKHGGSPKNKSISQEILLLPLEKLKMVIEGWYLTDGCYKCNQKGHTDCYSICTTSKELAYGLKIILEKLNIAFSISRTQSKKQVLIVKKRYDTVGKYDFNWTYDQKKTYSAYYDNTKITRIKNIEEEKFSGYVYNLEVEDDNSYIAEGFVVHNCVAQGYTDDGKIIFEDPSTFGKVWMTEQELIERWHDLDDEKKYENFGIVVIGNKLPEKTLEHLG